MLIHSTATHFSESENIIVARINIEDSIFKDIRFEDLKQKTGSLESALGALVRAWSIAQKFYLCDDTSRLIPISEWKKQRINPAILECGLAEQRGDFVYVCGSDEQFKWLIQKQEAGKKGGRPSNDIKRTTKKPPALSRKAEESGSNPLSPSLSPSPSLTHSPSPSLTHSQKNLQKFENTPTAIKAKPDSVESNISIGLYFTLYKNRYEGKAPLTGKHFSIIKNIIKSNGVDRTNQLLEAYFKMPDSYFVKRRHDVETFNSNLNQIAHYADTGSVITNNFADTRTANNAEALRKAMESVNE